MSFGINHNHHCHSAQWERKDCILRKRVFGMAGFALLLTLLFAGAGIAQRNAASIFGRVTDQTGAAVQGVIVKVTHDNTGIARTAMTNEVGNFTILDLPPGPYTLSTEAQGFKQYVQRNLVLNVDQRPQLNIALEVGATTESVTVQAIVPLVDSTHANIGGVVDNVNTEGLPLNGRQFLQLSLMLPGVSPNAGGQPTARGGGPRNVGVQLGGNRPTNNTYIIDGVDSFGFRFKNTSLRPSVASIQEFKVLNSPYDSQYGVVSGVTVDVITKSGGNKVHGELFEFFRNDRLDARNFFDLKKPPYRQNQYGGSVGGPIRKGKTFFFGTFEGFKSRRGLAAGAQVPTQAQLNGDFSADPNPIIDPLTGLPFPGNIIPSVRISDVARKFAALYPAPNSGLAAPNFINSSSDRIDEYQYVARLDHSFSNNWKAFARYTISNTDRLTPGTIPNFGTINLMTVQNASVGSSITLSPTSTLDVRVGFNREDALNGSEQVSKQQSSSFGIAGLFVTREIDGVPSVAIQGFNSIGDAGFSPEGRVENSEQFIVNYTRIIGRHTLRAGTTLWPTQLNGVFVSGNQRGAFTFTNLYSRATTGLPDFLLGLPQQAVRDIGIAREDARATLFNFYVADDFRVNPRLIVNLGLRYELRQAFIDKGDHLSVFLPEGQGRFLISGDPANGLSGRENRSLYPTPKKNFAPRIGIAWSLTEDNKTVLRTGYGIFYNLAIFNSQFLAAINAPFVVSRTYQADPARGVVLPFASPFSSNPLAGGLPGGLSLTPWFKQGYMQQWSLGIQRQLTENVGMEVTYLANKGTSLDGLRILNQGALPGATNAAYIRPFPNFGTFTTADSFGDSNYHSLQAKVTKRFSKGATFIGSYNYGHAIDNSSGEGGGSGGQFIIMDDRNSSLDRGPSDFDVRHRFTFSGLYDLPFGPGRFFLQNTRGFIGKLLEGWQVSGIWQVQSGFPFNIIQSGNRTGTFGGAERADRHCDGRLSSDQRSRTRWFDTSCFAPSPLGKFGNGGRGIMRYSGQNNLDFSLVKKTRIDETRYIEFRSEFFNLPNHTMFGLTGGVGNNVSVPSTFGVYTAAQDPRIIQFGLKLLF
jgi:hypothetical protein